jgi:hypothetical protein
VQEGGREAYVQQYELATFEVGVEVGGRESACSMVLPARGRALWMGEDARARAEGAVVSSLASGVARAVRRW